ncbi:MAG: peptide deformylase [bacterium]|nr:peptide deformylase [bacterium]
MSKVKIVTIPDPVLRQKSRPVSEIDKKVLELIKSLKNALGVTKNVIGIGIAAPQIGNPSRVCLIYSKESRKFLTLINPEVIWQSKRTTLGIKDSKNPYEGCLSVPRIWGLVRRHNLIKIRYLNVNGQVVTRKFKGLTAVIAQHEIDHLDGILFIDRVLKQKGKLFEMKKNKSGKDELVEMDIV